MGATDRSTQSKLSKLRLSAEEKRADGGRRRVVVIVLALIVVVGALVALAVHLSRRAEEAEGGVPSSAASSEPGPSAPAPPRRDGSHVAAGGYVEARSTSSVLPGRDGVVAAVHVKLGQAVSRGDVLLELESRTEAAEVDMARAELDLALSGLRKVRSGSRAEEVQAAGAEADAAEASRDEARRDLERLESLVTRGAVTAAEVDRARSRARGSESRLEALRARESLVRRGSRHADVQAGEAGVARAEAALERAEARLELARLRAPFDGTVLAVDVRAGEVVSLQSPGGGIEVADLSELWVRVDIPEVRIARVRVGAAAEVVIDALGQDRLAAEVVEIAPQADRQSNTVEVAVRLAEPPPLIRPNMSARVSIQAGEERP